MKLNMRTLYSLLTLSAIIILASQCKKGGEQQNENQESKFNRQKNFIEQKLKSGVIQTYTFDPGEVKTGSSRSAHLLDQSNKVESLCLPNITMNVDEYTVKYTSAYGCTGSPQYYYQANVKFTISFSTAVNYTGLSDQLISFHFSNNNTWTGAIPLSCTLLSQSGNSYKFETGFIDISGKNIEYCNVDAVYMEIWPIFNCNGSGSTSTDTYANISNINTFDRCKTVSPVFVNRTGTSADISGWLTCQPCNFMGSQQFEFQYRPVGSSTWTTVTYDYYLGPNTIFGLTSGQYYEYRWRNKFTTSITGTTAPCVGPYSDISTF